MFTDSILCGGNTTASSRQSTTGSAKRLVADDAETKPPDQASEESSLNNIINNLRASIFPPEHFSDTVELLEAELDVLVADKDSSIMTQAEYDELLLARKNLSSIHGDTLSRKAERRLKRHLARCATILDCSSSDGGSLRRRAKSEIQAKARPGSFRFSGSQRSMLNVKNDMDEV